MPNCLVCNKKGMLCNKKELNPNKFKTHTEYKYALDNNIKYDNNFYYRLYFCTEHLKEFWKCQ
jgi:hypothetical protein